MKGHTLIEFMLVVVFLSCVVIFILEAGAPPASQTESVSTHSNTEIHTTATTPVLQNTVAPHVDPDYVDGLRINNQTVTLKRHTLSGVLYACLDGMNKCYKVNE